MRKNGHHGQHAHLFTGGIAFRPFQMDLQFNHNQAPFPVISAGCDPILTPVLFDTGCVKAGTLDGIFPPGFVATEVNQFRRQGEPRRAAERI